MSVDNGAPHGAPHGPPHEAPSSPKPHSESSMSTEAMERAADTISAAIESFECQFAHREQHKAGEPRQGRHGLMFPQRAPETLDVGSQDGSRTAAGSVIDPELFIRPASADSYYSTPSSPAAGELSPSAVSLPGYLPGYFPGRSNSVKLETPMERRRRSEPPGSDFFVADIQPQGAGEWATTSDSTPTLAGSLSRKSRRLSYVPSGYHTDTSDVIDHFDTAKSSFNGRVRAASVHLPASELQRFPAPPRVHAVELPRPRTSAAYVDLFEAADRLRAVKESQIVSRPMSYPVANDPKAPSSIQIGGFTYIRQVPDLYPATEMPEKPEEPPAHRKGSPGGPPISLGHEIAFFSIIALAQVLMLSGVSQAMVPAEVIGDTFHVRAPADLAWFSASYALTSGTFVLPAGRLGDLFGHKKIFIIGFLWFAVWSVVTGFAGRVQDAGANGVIYFDICRAIQGIGPSLLVPNGQAMLGRAYAPGPRKALVMSLFGAAAPLGFVCGGVFASLFAQLMTWPWAFWVLGMACLVLSVASYFILPPTGETKKSTTDSIWLQLDLAGMFFGVAGLVLFNFAWNQAPVAGWETPYTYFMLIISIIFLGVFIYVELNATYPLLPISAMTARTNYVLGCVALGWGGFSIWVFYYIQVLEVLRGWSPLLTAASLAPGPVTGLIASLIVAGFMAKIGPHWIMVLSMCAFAVGGLFMATAPVDQIYWINTFLSVFIMPFGMDMSNPAASLLLSNSVSKEHQGIAASLVVTVVCYSISTFLGFAATVEVEVRKNGADVLEGFRAAQYFGVGVGVLGVCISLAYLWTTYREKRQEAAAALIPPKV